MKVTQLQQNEKRQRTLHQIFRVMKFTMLLLLVASMHVYADGFSQTKISLRLQQADLKKALSLIEKQTNVRFLYNQNVVKNVGKVSINATNEALIKVLNELLEGTGVSYKLLEDDLVVLNFDDEFYAPAEIKVTGTVTDSSGNPIPGATVLVKGTKNGTSTDAGGNYSINVADNAILVFSGVGFTTFEEKVNGRTSIKAVLAVSERKLDEVVVIGYGTASKRDLTGSIVKISGKDIADKPNSNPVASLQGRVAGLSIVNSGTPGAEPDIRIRGTVSTGSAKPLYVVDGILNDNISYLNPNDIESIEVLKDGSSLAIFGVRGAAGVIAITTKRAKAGQTLINFNSTWGAKKLTDRIKMVDAAGFKTLFEEEQNNLGITGSDRFNFAPWTGNTDWVNELTRTALFNTNNLSVAGSTERNKFYMSVGYIRDQGIVKHEELEKMLLSLSDEFKVNKNIKLGFNLNAFKQNLPFSRADGLLFDARRVLPITPVFNSDRNAYYDLAIQSAQITNPAMVLNNNWDKEIRSENRIVGSVYADINFLKDFNLRTTFYADMSNLDGRTYNPLDSVYNPLLDQVFIHPGYIRTGVSQSSEKWNKFQQDYILTYRKRFGEHSITATAGFTTYYNEYRGLFGSAKQSITGLPIPNDKRFWYIENGFIDPATRVATSNQTEAAQASGLVRVLYNYANKYYLNASFRRDGASQISPFNRYKNFYSIGAAWEATREKFMANQNIFDVLKVKGSWAILGNYNTFGLPYPFYPALQTGSTAVFGSVIAPAYSLAYEPNRKLTWESVEATEGGIEFAALRNRLQGDIVYYRKITNDLLSFVTLGPGNVRLDNIGKIRNQGVELQASWSDKITKDFSYSVSANFTTYNNKVVELPSGSKLNAGEERPNQTEQGYPIGYFYGYVVEGVYQSYADILKSPVMNLGNNYAPGDLKYKDVNGDGVVDSKDRTMIGNPTPDFGYGGNVTLRYKGLDLSVDFNGVYGNEIYRFWGSSELPFTKFNYPAFKLNRWNGEGTSNWDPALGDNRTTNRLPSTYGIEDGSYFRFRNVQLGYNFSPKTLQTIKVKALRLYANVQNLKTFKRNSGYTPEFGGSPTSFGIDNGNGPIPIIFTGGLNLSF